MRKLSKVVHALAACSALDPQGFPLAAPPATGISAVLEA